MFEKLGFLRRSCTKCGRFFWTMDKDRETCGDNPCDEYTFLRNPPTRRSYELWEMEREFLGFFEERGHKVLKRYPVVARWRDDIYLTIASIADFQPWVTSGLVPPPANPLVISQPSIRLKDIDNVGRSGKHFTLFFMGGHHAFNSGEKIVYWNNETVELCHEFLTERLGIQPEEITYVEGFWEGGGNAGEDFEVNVRGLEIATLVFMRYAVKNGHYEPIPLNVVDTGYGMERLSWLSKGTPTSYEAIFSPMIEKLLRLIGNPKPPREILEISSRIAGLMNVEVGRGLKWLRERIAERVGRPVDEIDVLLRPFENIYAVADHLRCLAFMFGDGIVPSNVAEGYLARLVLRRTIRLLRELGIDHEFISLMRFELELLKHNFPEIWERRDYILTVCELEQKRYLETIGKGERMVERMLSEKMNIENQLTFLYDSHGIPPEIVAEVCSRRGIKIEIPEDFYIKLSKLHSTSTQVQQQKAGIEVPPGLPQTELLYYSHPELSEFEATVVYSHDNIVVLDRTAFYPEGGGQPGDTGEIFCEGLRSNVLDVQKLGDLVIHKLDTNPFKVGDRIRGKIDMGRRIALMRHHTATHILLESAKRVLGKHVWQHGAQKGAEKSRLDITHYQRITDEQLSEIERLANRIVMENRRVKCEWVDRNMAEKQYGFELYQGGVVPGAKIRVVEIDGFNVQACGGLHCKSTGEVGPIFIIRSERLQDGVERLEFCAGESAVLFIQDVLREAKESSEMLGCGLLELRDAISKSLERSKAFSKRMEKMQERFASFLVPLLLQNSKKVGNLVIIVEKIELDGETLIKLGEAVTKREPRAVVVLATEENGVPRVIVMAGNDAVIAGVDSGEICNRICARLGGKGGGKPRLGQGGGGDISRLDETLRTFLSELWGIPS